MHSLQEAELAIAPLTLTAAREKAVGMTKPFMQTGISILLRKDISEGTGFFDFLTPFTAETWVGILIAYLGTAACIFIAARLVMQVVSFLFKVMIMIYLLMFIDGLIYEFIRVCGYSHISAGSGIPLSAVTLISNIFMQMQTQPM